MSRRKSDYIFVPERNRRRGPGCLMLMLSVALLVVVLSALTNNAMNKKVKLLEEKIAIMSLDKTYEGLSILHLSDLNAARLGEDADAWRSLLFGKKFAAVVMSGDMVGESGDFTPMVALIKLLRQQNAAAPLYFIAGDDDPPPVPTAVSVSAEPYADWVRAAQQAGAIYLDAPVSQPLGKKTVWFTPEYLYGVDVAGMCESLARQRAEMEAAGKPYEAEGSASYRALCCRLDAMERSAQAIKTMKEGDLQIAVTHTPLGVEYVRTLLEWTAEDTVFSYRRLHLVLAGHYAGGQWRLGALGPLYVPDRGWLAGDEGVVGLQRVNAITQYISGGLGASGFYPMPGRLFNAPSCTLLTFTARIR